MGLPTKDGDYRMCLEEVGILQGFPPTWRFSGPVYMALGQIGNAVPPPVAYAVGRAVRSAFAQ
jgi:DNA (cytosine-5)-methyltransferase 1